MIRWLIIAFMAGCATGARAQVPATKPASPLVWHRASLPCGARVVIIHVPTARKQATFTFLPLTMANDAAGRAQWSHLVEHMLIRSTDAHGFAADGVEFNGETTDAYMRLETFAEPVRWNEALARHARWLSPGAIDPAALEREKSQIEQEERSTAERSATLKFAVAAWNQVVAHGLQHAAVHGDVRNAAVNDVEAYVRQRVRLDDSVLIATIGPTPASEVEAELTRLLGDVPPPEARAAEPKPRDAPAASQPQVTRATWDLPTRHVLWWWPLENDKPETIAAANAATRALLMRVQALPAAGPMVRMMLATPVRSDDGACMMLNACIAPDVAPVELDAIVQAQAAWLCSRGDDAARQTLLFAARGMIMATPIEPDFQLLSKQMPERLRDTVEGQWLLTLMALEYASGLEAPAALRMLAEMSPAGFAQVMRSLRTPPRMLVLEPAKQIER